MQQTATQAILCDDDQPDVTAANNGDSKAFERLYHRHSGWLYGLCWRLSGGDRGLAEDWLQEVFVHAWNKLAQYSGEGSFGGWLRRLAVNRVLQDKRLKKNRMRLEMFSSSDHDNEQASAPTPPWPGADIDLERAIAQLPERARLVLVLYTIEGYTHEEIAGLTNMAAGSSKAQLHRARQLLQDWLNQ
ncbi:MAG: sigma-70 family RNA polymerase sigma factor [Wenzhouxiangellaceae bacterium]